MDNADKNLDKTHIFQTNILSELKLGEIDIYKFPIDDESIAEVNTQLNSQMPLAVVGSTDFVSIGNKMVRARQYPWGVVQGTIVNYRYLSIYNTRIKKKIFCFS